ncbi:hypothetical protein EDB82DRAFT_499477 [Fusarium venenatum]|uniref:uncharacterized protein n=1 Tax=Fusarium venenatum TaxID=56646 RepID=UPI001D2F21D8|nr:hypothetical protein EDB82DRAFT_499477 [Fusarium venenatum]
MSPFETNVPSYNIYDDSSKTAVLLCSYSWQQDSDRLGSLISTNTNHSRKVADEAALRELMIHDLITLQRNSHIMTVIFISSSKGAISTIMLGVGP